MTVEGPATGLSRKSFSVCALLSAVSGVLLWGACSAPPKVPFTHLKYWDGRKVSGYYYSVRRGDTLASIAKRFGCDLNLLEQMNGVRSNRTLGAAERIFIPRMGTDFPRSYYAKPRRSEIGRRVATTGNAPMSPPMASRSPPTPPPSGFRQKGIAIAQGYTKQRLPRSSQVRVRNAPRFQWPTGGVMTSGFNVRSMRKRLHMGIDIANKRGTPIRAAYSGRVLYSDSEYLPSMGNMVLIEHPGGWVTLYAHNARNLVREGDYVETGQAIALMGATGKATGPHLHFEIRKNADTPVNPLDYLPRRRRK